MEERDKDIIRQNQAEEEIDLIKIAAKLWAKRRFIIKVTAIFAAIGLFIAIFTPNVYTASTSMVPQTGEKRAGGSLSGLAAMAGINLGSMNSGEVLSPKVYPLILNNVNFQKELMYSKFSIKKEGESVTYFEYQTNKKYRPFNLLRFIKRYTIGLPGIVISEIKGKPTEVKYTQNVNDEIVTLSFEEDRIIKGLFENLSLYENEKEGYITLLFSSNEPHLSAEVVQTAQELLQKYITDFKLQKVKSNLEFIESSYCEAKKNFEEKQSELAIFRDGNISLQSAIAKTQEEKLTSEYNLLLGIYTELAKQKEQAKISVTETTPIFTIIKPAIVQNKKSGPNRVAILIGFSFFGLIIGIGYIIFNPFIVEIVKNIYQSS